MNTAAPVSAETIALLRANAAIYAAKRAAELATVAAGLVTMSDRLLAVLARTADADALPAVQAEIARRATV